MTTVAKKPMSKLAAVSIALKELGNDAMPVKIQEYVKKTLKIEMTTAHVSVYKSQLLKAKKVTKEVKPAAAATVAAPAKAKPIVAAPVKVKSIVSAPAMAKSIPHAPATAMNGSTLSLKDIEIVKTLMGRVGQENLKSLVGLLK